MKVCDKIKHLRQAQGLSQEEIAMKLDMSANGYGGIERGEVDIKLSRLRQLSELFGIELIELVERGEQTIFNVISDTATQNTGTLNHFIINSTSAENIKLKCEVEKLQMEVSYLKEIIELMKK
ncbi:MAG: helix-turn-helix transcriptional regulator [Methylococcaceae bacterium]